MPAKWVERDECVEALANLLSEALVEHPNIERFFGKFWNHCRRQAEKPRDLDRLPIPSTLFKKLSGGTSKAAGSGNAYPVYKEWMKQHECEGVPILTPVDPVRPGRCMTYRVSLPLCRGKNVWRSVTARLEGTTDTSGLTPSQIRSIRRRLSESAPYRHWFTDRRNARATSLAETTRMAAYHTLLTARGARPYLVARWPDECGVDLAAWHRRRPERGSPPILPPFLLVHVAQADEGLEPFEPAKAAAPHAECVLLCVGKPPPALNREARRMRIRIIWVTEPSQSEEE